MDYKFSAITPEIKRLAEKSMEGYKIDPELYTQYDVKRGLPFAEENPEARIIMQKSAAEPHYNGDL